jgi:hypothetical protein
MTSNPCNNWYKVFVSTLNQFVTNKWRPSCILQDFFQSNSQVHLANSTYEPLWHQMVSSFLFQFLENYYYLVLNHFVLFLCVGLNHNNEEVIKLFCMATRLINCTLVQCMSFPKEILKNRKAFGGSGMLFLIISK